MDVRICTDGLAQVDGQVDVLYPDKRVLLGPCMVMPQEVPGLTMRSINIPCDPGVPLETTLFERIVAEAMEDSGSVITALRDEGRFVEKLFELPEIDRSLPRLRFGGTVLIIGVVGGLGLQIAKMLFDRLQVRLVLTSRWQAPPREEWLQYVHEDSKMGRALRSLSGMVERGAEVLVVQADASDPAAMQHVIELADKAFGVVHAAGILALLG